MAGRPRLFKSPIRVQFVFEAAVLRESKKKARSLSKKKVINYVDYVTRLIVADIKKKRSSAHKNSRNLPADFFARSAKGFPEKAMGRSIA